MARYSTIGVCGTGGGDRRSPGISARASTYAFLEAGLAV